MPIYLTTDQKATLMELYRLNNGMPEVQQNILDVIDSIGKDGYLHKDLARSLKWQEIVDDAADYFGEEWRARLAFVQITGTDDSATALANQVRRFDEGPEPTAIPTRINDKRDATRAVNGLIAEDALLRELAYVTGNIEITIEPLPDGTLGLAELPPENIGHPHHSRADRIKLTPDGTIPVMVHEAAHAASEADLRSALNPLPTFRKIEPASMTLAELYDALLENALMDETFATQYELAAIRILPKEALDEEEMALKRRFEGLPAPGESTALWIAERSRVMEWMERHPGYYSYRMAAFVQALMLKAGMTDRIPSIEEIAGMTGFGNPKEQRVMINADRLQAFINDLVIKQMGANHLDPKEMLSQVAIPKLLELGPKFASLLSGKMSNGDVLEFLRTDFRAFVGIASNALDIIQNSADFKGIVEARTLQARRSPMQKGDPARTAQRPQATAYAVEIMSKYAELLAASVGASYDFIGKAQQGRALWHELLRYATTSTPENGARAFDIALAVRERFEKEMPITARTRLARALADSGYEQLGRTLAYDILSGFEVTGGGEADIGEELRESLLNEYQLEENKEETQRITADRVRVLLASRVIGILGVHAIQWDKDIARFAAHLTKRNDGAVLLAILAKDISEETYAKIPETKAFFDGLTRKEKRVIRDFTILMEIDEASSIRGTWHEDELNKRFLDSLLGDGTGKKTIRWVAQIFLELKDPRRRANFLKFYFDYVDTGGAAEEVIVHPTAFWAAISRDGKDLELTMTAFREAKKNPTPAINIILSDMAEGLIDIPAGRRSAIAWDILRLLNIPTSADLNLLDRKSSDRHRAFHLHVFPEKIDKALRNLFAYAIAAGDNALVADVQKRLVELSEIKPAGPLTSSFLRSIRMEDDRLGGRKRIRIGDGRLIFYPLFLDEISRLIGTSQEREWQLREIETDVAMQRHSVNVQYFLETVAAIERFRGNGALEPVIVRLCKALIDETIQDVGAANDINMPRRLFELIDTLPIPDAERDELLELFVERAMPRVNLGRSDETSMNKAIEMLGVAMGIFEKRAVYPKAELAAIQRIAEATRDLSLSASADINSGVLRLLGDIWQIYADDAILGDQNTARLAAIRPSDTAFQRMVENINTFNPVGQAQGEIGIMKAYEDSVKTVDAARLAAIETAVRRIVSDDLNQRLASGLKEQVRNIVLGRLPERGDLNDSIAERIFNDWKTALEGGNTTLASALLPLWVTGETRGESRHRMPLILEAMSLNLPNATARWLAREAFKTGEYSPGYIEAYDRAVESGDEARERLLQRMAVPVSVTRRDSVNPSIKDMRFPDSYVAAYIMDRPIAEGEALASHFDRQRKKEPSPIKDLLVAYIFQGSEKWLVKVFVDLAFMAHELKSGARFEIRPKSGVSPTRHRPVLDAIIQTAEAIMGSDFKASVEERLKEVFSSGWTTPFLWRRFSPADIDETVAAFARIIRDAKRLDDTSQDLQLEKIPHLKGTDWLKSFLVRRFLAQLSSGARQAIALAMEGTPESDATRIFFERTGLDKIGQFLSTWPQVSEEIRDELAHLQANVAQTPLGIVRHQIETAFAEHPEQEAILSNLDPTPLGSGTIGEVYKSKLNDGTPVAVKVIPMPKEDKFRDALQKLAEVRKRLMLYEGERNGISEAIALISLYLGIVEDEFDLEKEYANQKAAASSLPEGVSTPRFLDGMVTHKVAVMEFVEGIPLSKVQDALTRARLVEKIRKAFFGSIVNLIYHSDLQPGNFIYNAEKDIVYILDWGQVGRLTEDEFANVAELLTGLAAGNVKAVADVLEKMGRQREGYNRPSLEERVQGIAADARVLQMATGPIFGIFNAAANAGLRIALPYLHLLKGAASLEAAVALLAKRRNGGGITSGGGELPPELDGSGGASGEAEGGGLTGEEALGMGMDGAEMGGMVYMPLMPLVRSPAIR